MALADIQAKIATDPGIRKGPMCEVCALFARLDDTEAAALRGLLSDPTVRYSTLSEYLRDDPDVNVDIPSETLSRHARGRCNGRDRLR